MRRSKAPSQADSTKKIKFSTPFSIELEDENLIPNTHRVDYCLSDNVAQESKVSRSSTDVLKLLNPAVDHECTSVDLDSKRLPFQDSNKNTTEETNANADVSNSVEINKEMVKKFQSNIPSSTVQNCYYDVLWCKQSTRKHKKWEGDGVLNLRSKSAILYNLDGKIIAQSSGYTFKELENLTEGSTLIIGGKEIQVSSSVEEDDFKSGKCFSSIPDVKPTLVAKAVKPFIPPSKGSAASQVNFHVKSANPKFSIDTPNALVMPRPSTTHQWEFNKNLLPVVDVVVDPSLSVHLRPHQREGVVFLYECVVGLRSYGYHGAILADEMGLGKTLQCIALLWTLFKQGPYGGRPLLKKILILTPSSLTKNWMNEFNKWLGTGKMKVFVVDQNNKVEMFIKSSFYSVLIISYDMFIRCHDALNKVNFDLIVCDEGHRLKNSALKSTLIISDISTKMRIVLTGTPIQNDLHEFFSIVDFCNPGLLGSSSSFKKIYEDPIVKANQPTSYPEMQELGESRAAELSRLTGLFTLRRTQDVINKYLPPKVEMVLMCRPTNLQVQLYKTILASPILKSCFSPICANGSAHLMCISVLKKLCNHPTLLYSKFIESGGDFGTCSDESKVLYESLLQVFPPDYYDALYDEEHSGKMNFVSKLLVQLHERSKVERVVLVSSYTQTLDLLQKLCQRCNYKTLRLDGSTPSSQRQKIVDSFNNPHSNYTVFLLSSKAGGVGLNLIGASRILLYDINWNPAVDLQAMARVWRDGQKHKCYIYRLLIAGSIEEKIYQRQITKQGISGTVVDSKEASKAQFNAEDLKDLFSFQEDCICSTHDLLGCTCMAFDGDKAVPSDNTPVQRSCQLLPENMPKMTKNLSMAELMEWDHIKGPIMEKDIQDACLSAIGDDVTFLFQNRS